MKSKWLLLIGLAMMSLSAMAQNKVQGYILDQRTSSPLFYATIGAVHQSYGCYSDTTGSFTLYYLKENDSLKVSYLGYTSYYTTVQDLQKNAKILLVPNPVSLKEVVISPKKIKKKEMEIGYFTSKTTLLIVPAFSTNIYATYIPFPAKGETVVMKSLRFKYQSTSKNSPLRIRILRVKENGGPGEDMVTENLIFNDYKNNRKQVAVIDISKYNIIMPTEGVFIGLEWMNMDRTPVFNATAAGKNGPYINAIRTATPSNTKWMNSYNDSKWKELSRPSTHSIGLTVVNCTEK